MARRAANMIISRHHEVVVDLQWVGNTPKAVARDMAKVAERIDYAHPVFAKVMGLLEAGEVRHFARLHGKYIDSGDLMRSLTRGTAKGAIRELNKGGDGLEFGTSLYYSKFLTKSVQDPYDGQMVAGRRSGKKSAVIVMTRTTKQKVGKILADYVTEPYG